MSALRWARFQLEKNLVASRGVHRRVYFNVEGVQQDLRVWPEWHLLKPALLLQLDYGRRELGESSDERRLGRRSRVLIPGRPIADVLEHEEPRNEPAGDERSVEARRKRPASIPR